MTKKKSERREAKCNINNIVEVRDNRREMLVGNVTTGVKG